MRAESLITLLAVLLLVAAPQAAGQTTSVRRSAPLMDNPAQDAVVLDMVSRGMTVEVLTVQGNWARVRIPATSEVGWVDTGALAREDGAAPGAEAVREGMTGRELDRVEQRVDGMRGSLQGIEQRVDNLLRIVSPAPADTAPPKPAMQEREPAMPGAAGFTVDGYGQFRWRNQFVMGTYVRGGQDYYGLTLTRTLDDGGRNMLVGRAQYGLGEIRGKVDDFVDWTVGMDFNVFPRSYIIYPYFGAHFGMRHLLEDTPPDRNFFIAAPTVGVQAEIGSVFTLGVELRGLFRFENGRRRDDGMVGFSCGYIW